MYGGGVGGAGVGGVLGRVGATGTVTVVDDVRFKTEDSSEEVAGIDWAVFCVCTAVAAAWS